MIQVDALRKSFQGPDGAVAAHVALDGISFETRRGEFFTLLGPSGCGKTTTLRCVAGLERPDSGTISVSDRVVSGGRTFVPPNMRKLGMVFQSYAIWPHLTVRENVDYPLRHGRTRMGRDEVERATRRVLDLVQLSQVADRGAPTLSGGQQQRVALARALVGNPDVLLLDEPLSNLDARLRVAMRDELRRLTREAGVTALYVTHDQAEALALSDRIAVLNAGRIEQIGTPPTIYRRPASRFVAAFVGESNLVDGTVRHTEPASGLAEIETRWGRVWATAPAGIELGSAISIMIRPESMRLEQSAASDSSARQGRLNARVKDVVFLGDYTRCILAIGDETITAHLRDYEVVRPGDEANLTFDPEWAWVLPPESVDTAPEREAQIATERRS